MVFYHSNLFIYKDKTMSKEIRQMIDKVKNFNQFINENTNIDNYMLGGVKYSWIKNEIKNVLRIEPKETTRLEILSDRKKELRLDEFQTLYDYWNFCDKNTGNFRLANNPIENYKRVIKEWTWYLVMIQLFPNELKNAQRDFYTIQYDEIKTLPKLTGELEKDKVIFENAVRNFFMKPNCITRQSLTSYDIHFKSLF